LSRFVIHISEKKRRNYLIRACLLIAFSLSNLAMLGYYLFSNEELKGMRKAFYIVMAIQTGVSGVEYLQKRKRKEFFLEIDEHYLKWLMHETGDPTITDWNDIRWIKKEKDKGILIFRDSSFSVGFSVKDFQETEQEQIIALLEKYALEKQIRLVNFSEPSLVLA
jgi:hypothetical protein